MTILDRYIGLVVLKSTVIVMLFLVALFSFFSFVDQLGNVGTGNYGSMQAAQYVVLIIPRIIYQMFPIAVLIGVITGLGMLANNNELVVIRAAGVSIRKIIFSVMKTGMIFILLVIILGEWVAPVSERYAQVHRSVAMSGKLSMKNVYGLWARDGLNFVNVQKILPQGRLGEVNIYEFNDDRKLIKLIQAKQAHYIKNKWVLEDVVEADIGDDHVKTTNFGSRQWITELSPDLLSIVIVKPETLSILGLYQYIRYLDLNELDAAKYELALWGKLVAPFITGVMVVLAIPFVFGSLRSVSIGQRAMFGTLVGMVFYIVNQVVANAGLVNNWNIALSATLPAVVMLTYAIYRIRKLY